MKQRTRLLTRLAGGLLAAAFALPLHAGVSSNAVIDITNFTIGGSGFAFSSGQPVSSADVAAELTGFPNSSLSGTTANSLLDLATVCVGTCPQIGSNAFPVLSGAPLATFSTSDQYRSGSLTTGARIANGAYSAIDAGQKESSADSNNNLQGTFVVGTSGPVTLTFDARAYLESFVSAGEAYPGFSTAAYSVSFSILNLSGGGTTVFSWSPNGTAGGIVGGTETADPFTLNGTLSLNAPVPGDTLSSAPHQSGVASTGRFQAVTNSLVPGNLYQLSMRVTTNSDATRVLSGLLGDRVWEDGNGNGIQDCADTNGNGILGDAGDTGPECDAGVPNATVYLRTPDGGGNCTGPVLGSAVTNADGFYQFSGLPAGSYCVQFVPPTNYCGSSNALFTLPNQGANDAADSDAAVLDGTTQAVTLAGGDINRTLDAGIYCLASLGDFVWNDTNQNGIQDGGEPGIPNVVAKLYTCDGTELASTTTDANGYYSFMGLMPGSYYVGFTAPAGYVFTLLNQGGNPAVDSNAQSNGQTACVTLASGENNPTIDAGLYQPATAQLGDFVWHDLNANGIQDANEQGIPGATVTLFACNSTTPLASTATNSNGLYLFQGLAAGSYYVRFDRPVGYDFASPQNQGANDGLDSDADPTTGVTACVSLAQGESNLTVDAGFYRPAALGDRVWNDANQNGIQDNGEPGIEGVTVKLYTCDGTFVAETTTDANGIYGFSGLMPGSYYVEFVPLAGYVITAQDQGANDAADSDADSNGRTVCVTLQSGETNNTVDAGLYLPALSRLGDFVWNDLNADGIQNVGEPGIAGVKVTLYACNSTTPLASMMTNASGYYLFQNLMAGSYYVNFERPAAYPSSSPQDQGGDDALDSDADPVTGNTACVTLGIDETNLTVDAGFYFPARPTIDVEKATNGDDADFPTGPYITIGGTVTWTYVVTNTGNVPLTDVVVSDNKEGTICTIATLDVGASATCTKTGTAMAGQYANLATATGWYMGMQVSDTDPSHYYGKPSNPGTGTPGYWMNHPEAWPVNSITIGGVTYSKMQAIKLMLAPTSTDVTYIMFQALVAAKLNVLIGNDASCIADTIAAADAWMAKYGPVGSNVKGSSKAWKIGEPLYKKLDQYNNGLLCAPSRG
jgi:protocatechuate 3,4-dioxygenase beta subunit